MCAQVCARRLYSTFEQSILAEHNIHNDTVMEQFMFQSHGLIKIIHWRYLKLIVHICWYTARIPIIMCCSARDTNAKRKWTIFENSAT